MKTQEHNRIEHFCSSKLSFIFLSHQLIRLSCHSLYASVAPLLRNFHYTLHCIACLIVVYLEVLVTVCQWFRECYTKQQEKEGAGIIISGKKLIITFE